MSWGMAPALVLVRALAAAPDSATMDGPALVDDDVANDGEVGPPAPLDDCPARLEQAGARFETARIPVHDSRGGRIVCGAEQIVRYLGGPARIRWSSRPKLTCKMALALVRFEAVVQEEAQRHLGRRVGRIVHKGTYSCREMAAYPGWVSEHSYANAIDVASFVLVGGKELTVARHWGKTASERRESRFLRSVARRLYDEDVFAVVLTPAFDRAHHDHFHLDLARYRVDGAAEPFAE